MRNLGFKVFQTIQTYHIRPKKNAPRICTIKSTTIQKLPNLVISAPSSRCWRSWSSLYRATCGAKLKIESAVVYPYWTAMDGRWHLRTVVTNDPFVLIDSYLLYRYPERMLWSRMDKSLNSSFSPLPALAINLDFHSYVNLDHADTVSTPSTGLPSRKTSGRRGYEAHIVNPHRANASLEPSR